MAGFNPQMLMPILGPLLQGQGMGGAMGGLMGALGQQGGQYMTGMQQLEAGIGPGSAGANSGMQYYPGGPGPMYMGGTQGFNEMGNGVFPLNGLPMNGSPVGMQGQVPGLQNPIAQGQPAGQWGGLAGNMTGFANSLSSPPPSNVGISGMMPRNNTPMPNGGDQGSLRWNV